MYGHESWIINKAESQRIDAFEMWCCRRLLRVPWAASRPNQSILKELSPEYSLKGLLQKLKPLYFGQLMQRTDLLEKTLMLCKGWRQEEKGVIDDEMIGWHYPLKEHEFEKVLGDGEGQPLKAVYCHPAYLTHMQSTSCKMPGCMQLKLNSRLLEEISTT